MITRKKFLEGGLASLLALQYSELFERAGNGQVGDMVRDEMSVREAVARRRTVRRFSSRILRHEQLMGVLWAAQGITDSIRGLRAVPSAGALYPLEIYAFLGDRAVVGMEKGVYHYQPQQRDAVIVTKEDQRQDLARASVSQMWIAQAPVSLVISAVYARTTGKYGKRGIRYADIEAGCAAQNVFLVAISLGLEAGIVGAFDDDRVRKLTGAAADSHPLLVMPIGYRA
jgi:SagB-type dehydrogenase family enzyme